MAPQKSPGLILMEKADKKAASSVGWFSFSDTKWEEAADLYQQAGAAFKIDKLFKDAGDAYSREAECRENGKESNDAANAWWSAAKAYKTEASINSKKLAIEAYKKTVGLLTTAGRFRQAADRQKDIALLHLQGDADKREACKSYQQAGEWYAQEDANATANAMYKDAADLYANLGEYEKAIELYEKVAKGSLGSNLTKYSVKDYWLQAGLCALAMGETNGAKKQLDSYDTLDNGFSRTREAKFLNLLLEAVEQRNVENFTAAVVEFDQIMKLDDRKTEILLKVKKSLEEEPSML